MAREASSQKTSRSEFNTSTRTVQQVVTARSKHFFVPAAQWSTPWLQAPRESAASGVLLGVDGTAQDIRC